MPHAWPDVRQGRIRWAETLSRPSLLVRFVELHKVKRCDVACPEGATSDGGVEDVDHSFIDSAFGSVINDKWFG